MRQHHCLSSGLLLPKQHLFESIYSALRHQYISVYSDCSNGTVGHAGLCIDCGVGCLTCSVGSSGDKVIVCSQCSGGYILNGGNCIQSCQANCRTCNGSTCLACNPLYALLNNFCVPRKYLYIQNVPPEQKLALTKICPQPVCPET